MLAGLAAVQPLAPDRLWGAWTFDPAVVLGLAAAAVAYARGQGALGRRARPVLRRRQAASFAAGLVLLGVALVSPLDALATTLLSAHMVQHLILLVVSPLLIVDGRPRLPIWLGLPRAVRRRLAALSGPVRRLTRNPAAVLVLVTATLWGWHLPGPYEAAVAHPALHASEHLSFLGAGLAFWSLVVEPGPRRRLGHAPAMLLVFASMLAGSALGALITFSPHVLYPVYQAGAALWGTSALADQQLAGALMWVPPGLLDLIVIVVLAARWFAEMDRRVRTTGSAGAGA